VHFSETNNSKYKGAKLPVLVCVDHEEEILNLLNILFRFSGYELNLFTSPLSALDFLKENSADVIISEMRMPEMSGCEFFEKSLEYSPDSIKVIISGYEEKSVILDCISNGFAQHYIMKPWLDSELKKIVSNSIELKKEMHRKHLEKLLHSIGNLPAPPKMYIKLINILQKDSKSQKEIAEEIEKSPELVIKLLRVSNSIYYGARKEISTVSDAITFIGTEAVLNLVLSLESFRNVFKNANQDVLHKSEEMRLTSVHRAQVARQIASQWHEPINPHEAYIAGLMLDIGFFFRFSSSSKDLNDFLKLYHETNEPAYIIDKKLFEVTHDEVGEALLTYWNFANLIVSTVADHHSIIKNNELLIIAQLSDYIVQGKDSLPHDPIIDEYHSEWVTKLKEQMGNEKIDDVI